ncbi:hypothetical protein [Actinoplanes palleronii]|uniref:DUF4129 domain-containing protein n=1 Tax=Actinoplanes palleronii TaxID=113570 RepID=A0ABQ4BHR9_9ACTN|nr:hypothetical protein [Actinoplanes palleronii]GIE70202.1 hypothetical protein Apa02nite_063100 [Actinoplanes palleronii]
MLSGFVSGLGGKLADQWAARLLTPALVFWLAGALAWAGDAATLRARGHAFTRLTGTEQVLCLVGGLLLVAASTAVAERVTPTLLSWLEGYWPAGRPRWLWNRLVALARRRRHRWRDQWGRLRRTGERTAHDRTREGVLAGRLHRMPPEDALMPTLLGNTLRAAELRTARRYGLDPVIAWPRLWPLLSETARQDITGARAQLDAAGRAVLWAVAAAVWATLVWWLVFPALLAAVAIYRASALPAAAIYADLVEAAFDTQRFALYEALRLPPPSTPDDEPAAGRALTAYLWEGFTPPAP